MSKQSAPRAAAAFCLQQVLQHHRSLTQVMPEAQEKFKLTPADKSLCQAIVYGVLRELPALEWLLGQLLQRPLKNKVRIVHYILLSGLHQLRNMRTASHAAVDETVNACVRLRQQSLKGLVNGVLRNYLRQQDSLSVQLSRQPDIEFGHPKWIISQLRATYAEGERWRDIIAANNRQAPMWLRVNARHHTAESYARLLNYEGMDSVCLEPLPQALCLKRAVDVNELPGFEKGWVSVQDGAAQHAALLLDAQPGERILDACAAPGGKTAHILELSDCDVTAIDIDETRLQRIEENLSRLGLQAKCLQGDASLPDDWWDGELYDRILLDAPCTATGVIRRHPDIKWLRQHKDIVPLTELQATIMSAQWKLLKPGGVLLYATCSILPEENKHQIRAFLASHPDAISEPLCKNDSVGWQLIPGDNDLDGFFYARLRKQSK